MPDPAERTPIATAPLSLILVAYDAGADVDHVVKAWSAVLDARAKPYEILLVNDGSSDDTALRADMLAAAQPRLRVLHHVSRQGFGGALRSGLAAAQHPLLAYTTCDRQYQPAEFGRLLGMIDKVELVIGYRQWLPVPAVWRVLGWFYRACVRVVFGIWLEPLPCWLGDGGQAKRALARWVFGVRVQDVGCAFRLFRRSIFARIPLQSHGPFVQTEILAKANFLGCWMAEAPVSYTAPPGPPLLAAPRETDTYLAEARRLFNDPYFGPPNLDAAPAALAVETPAAPSA